MKSSDGGNKYLSDKEFIKRCFIFTCLNIQNRCYSDKNHNNHFTLYQKTLCDGILKKFKLDKFDKDLLNKWNEVLKEAKRCKEFKNTYKYGLCQIVKEIASLKE
jgi:hypothetical protein